MKAVRRYGRGLNSFLYRSYGKPSKQEATKSMYAANDPDRYHVQATSGGEFQVVDRNIGKPVATQLESRDEAQGWINEALKGGLSKTG